MKITSEWLEEKNACEEGTKWFCEQKETEPIAVVNALIKEDKLDWANWLLPRCMDYKQCVSYAVFAAEQVIDIFEKRYPNDDRPRKAIEAAKKCIESPSDENKKDATASASSAYAASAAADAASAADAAVAAYAAAYAAAAVYAAYANANAAAYAAVYAASAVYAAYANANAAAYARKTTMLKILDYGIELLKEGV